MAYKVMDIANELLKRAADNGGGDLLTNLKLQKMLCRSGDGSRLLS